MVKNLSNRKKTEFLNHLNSKPSIEDNDNNLAKFCKFNFSFLDLSQEHSGKIDDSQLISLLIEKLLSYFSQPLDYWREQRVGSGKQSVLEIYKTFPSKSGFKEPKGIPHEALWARFRMDGKKRLVGFILPKEFDSKKHSSGYGFDINTFYVVFLDPLHKFYIANK